MIKEFPGPTESMTGPEMVIAEVNKKLAALKDDPGMLEDYFDRALETVERDGSGVLLSKTMAAGIVRLMIGEISPSMGLDPIDSKEFAARLKKININEIKLKVTNLINKKRLNKQFFKNRPDELFEAESGTPSKERKEEPEELGHFQKMAKKYFPGDSRSFAEHSDPEKDK